jgi:hypothetical protein
MCFFFLEGLHWFFFFFLTFACFLSWVVKQAIQSNPERFFALLNEGVSGDDVAGDDDDMEGLGAGAGAGGPGGAQPQYIEVTQSEKEAIDRVRF